MGRVARAATDKSLDAVSAAMDQEQAAIENTRSREAARLAGQT